MDEMTLHLKDEVFDKLRNDSDEVLQKLLTNMTEKGSTEGRLTITIDISFLEETIQNKNPEIEGDRRLVHTPKFSHKVGSVLQIKSKHAAERVGYGLEMVYDYRKKEYVLKPILGGEQMSFYDMENTDEIPKLPLPFEE